MKMKTKADLEKIENEVNENYLSDKFKSTCETIKDLETQIAYLQSKEGWAIASELSGSEVVKEQLKKVDLALKERKVEREFIRDLLTKP